MVRRHGKTKFEMIAGPEVPQAKQIAEMRELIAVGAAHPRFAEVQRWTSDDGLDRTVRYRTPDEQGKLEAKQALDTEAHKKHLESLKEKADPKPVAGINEPEVKAVESEPGEATKPTAAEWQ